MGSELDFGVVFGTEECTEFCIDGVYSEFGFGSFPEMRVGDCVPLQTMANTDKDLRVWYHKYNAYEMTWTQIQALRSKGQWQFNLGKTELINLFGKRSMWNSHVRPAMR